MLFYYCNRKKREHSSGSGVSFEISKGKESHEMGNESTEYYDQGDVYTWTGQMGKGACILDSVLRLSQAELWITNSLLRHTVFKQQGFMKEIN